MLVSFSERGREKKRGRKKKDLGTGKDKAETCLKSKMEIQYTPHLEEHEQRRGVGEEKTHSCH